MPYLPYLPHLPHLTTRRFSLTSTPSRTRLEYFLMRCAMIAVWIGPLPPWIRLFVESCRINTRYHWFVFTDQPAPEHDVPNVSFLPCTLREVQQRATTITGWEFAWDQPYKICDLRPMFGEMFSDITSGYTHWAHCDIDIIWGELDAVIPSTYFDTYDILSMDGGWICGPCTFYKNTPRVNGLYRRCTGMRRIPIDPCYDNSRSPCREYRKPFFRHQPDIEYRKAACLPNYSGFEEKTFCLLVTSFPDIRCGFLHHQATSEKGGHITWNRGKIIHNGLYEKMMMHIHLWNGDVLFPNLHMEPVWDIHANGIDIGDPKTESANSTVRSYYQDCTHGILTATSAHCLEDFLRLHRSVRIHGNIPIAVVDLDLSTAERKMIETCSGVTILPAPPLLKITNKKETEKYKWTKPFYFDLSPFRYTLWIDTDCILTDSLDDAFRMMEDRAIYALDDLIWIWGKEEWTTNKPGLEQFLPVGYERPNVHVNSGVVGFDLARTRDKMILSQWQSTVEQAAQSFSISSRIKNFDQGCLEWVLKQSEVSLLLYNRKWNRYALRKKYKDDETLSQQVAKDHPGASIAHWIGEADSKLERFLITGPSAPLV